MKNCPLFALSVMLVTGMTATPAAADLSARYEAQEKNAPFNMAMTLEIDSNGNERVQVAEQPTYLLVLNNVTYMVSRGPAGVYVMRLDDMVTVIGEVSKRMGIDKAFASMPKKVAEKPPAIASMGPKVVNGRTGTGYGISENGARPVYAFVVISEDPKLAPLGAAFAKSFAQSSVYANKMFPGFGSMGGMFGSDAELFKKGAPLSIVSMNLTDVSFAEIDDSRFALPGQPLSIDQIRQQYQSFSAPPTLPAARN